MRKRLRKKLNKPKDDGEVIEFYWAHYRRSAKWWDRMYKKLGFSKGYRLRALWQRKSANPLNWESNA